MNNNTPCPVIAITLGSNGFHLLCFAPENGQYKEVAHLHENVKGESFLDDGGGLTPDGVERVLGALKQFTGYLLTKPDSTIAAIATGTFRKATNASEIIEKGSEILGCPIKVLSGQEESLLCYQGIASSYGLSSDHRLVLDIGGGSTELMIAKNNSLIAYCSLDLGCVSLNQKYFAGSRVSEENLDAAISYAEEIIKPNLEAFNRHGWVEAMGCGGTVSGLFAVLQANRMVARALTPASLERFKAAILETGSAEVIGKTSSTVDRIELLPAGVSILWAVFNLFEVEKIMPTFTSVGQGLLIQMIQQQTLGAEA